MRVAWVAAASMLALAGCGGEEPPPVVQSFAPLHYEYLPKIQLNVGEVRVADHSLPVSPQDVAASSPAVPARALEQMARDRLFAAGSAGKADFVIDQASIVREANGALDGQLAVHLDLVTASGVRGGFAEARVARQHVPGSDAEDGSATLYALTRQMMDAMNVELEYQIRHSLQAWLVTGGAAPVIAQPLATPGEPQPPAAPPLPPAAPDGSQAEAPAAPAPPATVPDDGYQDPAGPAPPQVLSPLPGYLRAPPGTTPVLPPSGAY